jgi:hypothetical protein
MGKRVAEDIGMLSLDILWVSVEPVVPLLMGKILPEDRIPPLISTPAAVQVVEPSKARG